jgi:hypothetical protein
MVFMMPGSLFVESSMSCKGPFINYVRLPREEGLEKSLHTLTLGGRGSNPFLRNIFQVDFYIINRAVKWFGRDHISFAPGR